jgi:hypothetical protein
MVFGLGHWVGLGSPIVLLANAAAYGIHLLDEWRVHLAMSRTVRIGEVHFFPHPWGEILFDVGIVRSDCNPMSVSATYSLTVPVRRWVASKSFPF